MIISAATALAQAAEESRGGFNQRRLKPAGLKQPEEFDLCIPHTFTHSPLDGVFGSLTNSSGDGRTGGKTEA